MNKIWFCALGLIALAFNCIPIKRARSLTAINVNYDLPIVNWDNSITNVNSNYNVYYYDDMVMYRNFYDFDSVLDGRVVKREKRPQYLVFHKDSTQGQLFYTKNSHSLPKGRLPLDSTLKLFSLESIAYDVYLTQKPDSLFADNDGSLVKAYVHKPTKQYPEAYTTYFYYTTAIKNIAESLSKKMDNIKNRKLFKIVLKAKGTYYEEHKMTFPSRVSIMEMKKIPVENKEEIINYFKLYKENKLVSR